MEKLWWSAAGGAGVVVAMAPAAATGCFDFPPLPPLLDLEPPPPPEDLLRGPEADLEDWVGRLDMAAVGRVE